jgi:hypothetical protein
MACDPPPTGPGLTESLENRYDLPQIPGSSGESQLIFIWADTGDITQGVVTMFHFFIRRICVICMVALALTGCETAQELDKRDEAYCKLQSGQTMLERDNKAYTNCRDALVTARARFTVEHEWPNLLQLLISVLFGSAAAAAVINAVWFGLLWIYKASGRRLRLQNKTYNVSLKLKESITRDKYETLFKDISFYCLLVKFGRDDYLSKMASDEERFEGRQRLERKDIRVTFDEPDRVTFVLELPIHKTLGTQFKCFAEARSIDRMPAVIEELKKCEIEVYSYERTRMYFLLDQFTIIDTIEKLKNNYIYPS